MYRNELNLYKLLYSVSPMDLVVLDLPVKLAYDIYDQYTPTCRATRVTSCTYRYITALFTFYRSTTKL